MSALAPAPIDEAAILAALAEVPDPELPVVSIVDLGMIGGVRVTASRIRVEVLPTFVGCPALEVIRASVAERLGGLVPDRAVEVVSVLEPAWTSDRITEAGRARLAAAGIAPPDRAAAGTSLPLVRLDAPVACPLCGSTRTRLDNAFGPTLCRTIRYCTDCRQPFEQLKTI